MIGVHIRGDDAILCSDRTPPRLLRHKSLVLLSTLIRQSSCILELPRWDLALIQLIKLDICSAVSLIVRLVSWEIDGAVDLTSG